MKKIIITFCLVFSLIFVESTFAAVTSTITVIDTKTVVNKNKNFSYLIDENDFGLSNYEKFEISITHDQTGNANNKELWEVISSDFVLGNLWTCAVNIRLLTSMLIFATKF